MVDPLHYPGPLAAEPPPPPPYPHPPSRPDAPAAQRLVRILPRVGPPARVAVAVLLLLPLLPVTPGEAAAAAVRGSSADAAGPRQEGQEGEPPRGHVQGLPPAPPPSGIRPSRPRGEAGVPSGPPARRATTEVLGGPVVVEVRGLALERADGALRAAVEAMREVETLFDPEGSPAAGGVATLHAAGGETVEVDPQLVAVLERALSFCRWSDQAHGPLGGGLYRLWGHGGAAAGRPPAGQLETASRAAACDRVAVQRASPPGAGGAEGGDGGGNPPRAQLAEGSRLDLWGFARGFAVDRAMEVLREEGAENAFVELGPVRRASGPGPAGAGPEARGWPVVLPVFPGQPRPLDRVWLRDEAMAVSSAVHEPLLVGGDRLAPYVDQRSGRPAEGVVGVVVVSDLAVDAEALAASLMILGNREGLLRVGNLKPSPHVLWLLGSGTGAPVLSQYNWTEVSLR